MRPILFLCLLLPLLAVEIGKPLPTLRGEFLTGKPAVLPEAAGGKPALLALGFTYSSRFAVEAYVKRFRADFPDASRVPFFEVPMISGLGRLGRWFIDSGMRRGTPKADHEHVITVYSGAAEWKKQVGYTDPAYAYLLLLDRSGRVVWTHQGVFDAAKAEELATRVRALLP